MKLEALMGKLLLLLVAMMIFGGVACKKSDTTSSTATMSATINGKTMNFTVTLSNSNGYTVITGTNTYTLTLVLKTMGAAVYTLADQSTGYYATLTDNLGNSYSTDIANTGQITLSASGIRYNGTFYFTANETSPVKGGGNITVSNGSCTNI